MGLLGSSSSKSSSTTNQYDNRVVADAQAQAVSNGGQVAKDFAQPVNVVVNSSGKKSSPRITMSVTSTDYGALEFADSAVSGANKTVQDVLGVSAETFDKTTTALQEAYQDAKGGALVLQNVTIGMMLTIAALGYFWLGKKKQ